MGFQTEENFTAEAKEAGSIFTVVQSIHIAIDTVLKMNMQRQGRKERQEALNIVLRGNLEDDQGQLRGRQDWKHHRHPDIAVILGAP